MNYERPNEKWICGHACEGKACRIGPSRWGRCRATFECQPAKDGSRWRCTRPKSDGGPCADGPLPDGPCCRAIPRCTPVRSLRAKRGLVAWWTVAVTVGALLIAFGSSWREAFINPVPLSQAHAALTCAACHTATTNLIHAAIAPASLDCRRCHAGHDFHNAKAPFEPVCTTCHREHSGPGPMPTTADANCAQCHSDTGLMKVAFTSFANHPPFHSATDTNTLKFNHQKHLTGEIPLLNGRKLDCADCHQPDAAGVYHRPITFASNCRACHALQFDDRNPDLHVPHGDTVAVRAFLRSLPTQYADLATHKGVADVESFVTEQMTRLREQVRSGEDLERQTFFNTERTGPEGRPRYPGCAYCHEVKASGNVTTPVTPDRWWMRGTFTHAKHTTVACAKCHDVLQSRETADVLLPAKATCASCHSLAGGVTSSCATCHGYHNPPVTALDSGGTSRTATARREK